MDELVSFAVAAAIDVAAAKAAKRRRWVRIVQIVLGLMTIALLILFIAITVVYS